MGSPWKSINNDQQRSCIHPRCFSKGWRGGSSSHKRWNETWKGSNNQPLPQWGPALPAPRNGVVIDEFPQHQAHHFHGNARAAVLQHLPGARVSDTHQNGTMLEGYNRVKIRVFAASLSKSYGVCNDMIWYQKTSAICCGIVILIFVYRYISSHIDI